MSLSRFDNCICYPNPENARQIIVKALAPVNKNDKVEFVSVKYQNPGKGMVEFDTYGITETTYIGTQNTNWPEKSHHLKARTNKAQYIHQVQLIKEQIQLGNVYEMNYCLEFFETDTQIDVLQVFVRLIELTKAPYTYLLKLGESFVICCSPELFIRKKGSELQTKPIKGTIKRGKDRLEDEALKNNLQQSIKERTENVMAVDVARNDLSKIANRGSVQVNKLYNIETFETVHQMVSTVSCEIDKKTSLGDIIQATFPMASMTGAPKNAAMTLIDRFENFDRGHYSGAFGLVNDAGDFEWPVVIRSIYYDQKRGYLSLAAGGAITYLSEPELEYDEIILKLSAQLKVLNAQIEF